MANHTFLLGPTGQEIQLSDLSKYIFPPDGFKWTPVRREIFRERRTGGTDLSYSREMRLEGHLSMIIVAQNGSYQAALDNYNGLRQMMENARQYWRRIKDTINVFPPVYYSESFFDQTTPTLYTVLTGELPIGSRKLLAGGAIETEMSIIVDAPSEDNQL